MAVCRYWLLHSVSMKLTARIAVASPNDSPAKWGHNFILLILLQCPRDSCRPVMKASRIHSGQLSTVAPNKRQTAGAAEGTTLKPLCLRSRSMVHGSNLNLLSRNMLKSEFTIPKHAQTLERIIKRDDVQVEAPDSKASSRRWSSRGAMSTRMLSVSLMRPVFSSVHRWLRKHARSTEPCAPT